MQLLLRMPGPIMYMYMHTSRLYVLRSSCVAVLASHKTDFLKNSIRECLDSEIRDHWTTRLGNRDAQGSDHLERLCSSFERNRFQSSWLARAMLP